MVNKCLIAIDPSIRIAGVSVWHKNILHVAFTVRTIGEYSTWQDRAIAMACKIGTILNDHKASIVVTEIPENWHSQRGNVSKDSESIQKLYYYVGLQTGMIPYICQREDSGVTIFGITPNAWKGNVPKNVMLTRCNKVLKQQGLDWNIKDHNVAEAILLGNKAVNEVDDTISHTIVKLEKLKYVVLSSMCDRKLGPMAKISSTSYWNYGM